MLRSLAWISRTIGLAIVGPVTFLSPPSSHSALRTQVVAYALVCLACALWALADLWPHAPAAPVRRAMTAAVVVITAASGLGAAAGGSGDCLIAFGAVALVTAAGELALQTALLTAALGVLAVEVGGIVFDQGVGTLLGLPMLLAVGVMIGRQRASYRIQAEQAAVLLAQHELLRTEQRRADILAERTRLAREIHDVLAHSLGALGIQLQTVRALFAVHNDPERALEALAAAQRMASEGLTETRRAVYALRDDTLLLPLPEEIARAAAEHADRHQVTVHCETSGTPLPVPPDATVALLRVAQESLVNAAKHAPGRRIDLRLDYQAPDIRLTVSSDLPGDRTDDTHAHALHTLDGGYGLTGMRERLRLLRGTLEAGPQGSRWVVAAHLRLSPTPSPFPSPQRADR